jgi:hypothetical protein
VKRSGESCEAASDNADICGGIASKLGRWCALVSGRGIPAAREGALRVV